MDPHLRVNSQSQKPAIPSGQYSSSGGRGACPRNWRRDAAVTRRRDACATRVASRSGRRDLEAIKAGGVGGGGIGDGERIGVYGIRSVDGNPVWGRQVCGHEDSVAESGHYASDAHIEDVR